MRMLKGWENETVQIELTQREFDFLTASALDCGVNESEEQRSRDIYMKIFGDFKSISMGFDPKTNEYLGT